MSAEPPPAVNRVPLAKSAPALSASTNLVISAGSAEPSASNMTTMSPVTRREARGQGVALALAALQDRDDVGQRPAGCHHGAVDGAAVDEDDLVDLRKLRQHHRQVQRLVERRHHDADQRVLGVPFRTSEVDRHACVTPRVVAGPPRFGCDDGTYALQGVARKCHSPVTKTASPQVRAALRATDWAELLLDSWIGSTRCHQPFTVIAVDAPSHRRPRMRVDARPA